MKFKSKIANALIASAVLGTTIPFNAFASNNMPNDFSKIPDAAKESVKELYERGYLSGYENGKFEPTKSITRAEFTAILIRVLGLKYGDNNTKFSDSKKGKDWHYNALNIANKHKLLTGVGSDKYGLPIMKPNDTITRLEMMMMLVRAHESFGDKTTLTSKEVTSILDDFKDGKSVPTWARIGVAKAIKSGITTGVSKDKLGFKENGNRLQSALFSFRTLNKKEKLDSDNPNENVPNNPGEENTATALDVLYATQGAVYTHLEPLLNPYTKPFFDNNIDEELVASQIVYEEFEKMKKENPEGAKQYLSLITQKTNEVSRELEKIDPSVYTKLEKSQREFILTYVKIGTKTEAAYRSVNNPLIISTTDKALNRLFDENPKYKASYEKYKAEALKIGGEKAVTKYETLIKGYLTGIVPIETTTEIDFDKAKGSLFEMDSKEIDLYKQIASGDLSALKNATKMDVATLYINAELNKDKKMIYLLTDNTEEPMTELEFYTFFEMHSEFFVEKANSILEGVRVEEDTFEGEERVKVFYDETSSAYTYWTLIKTSTGYKVNGSGMYFNSEE